MTIARTINSRIGKNPRVLIAEGDVPLPILWGDDNASVVGGITLTDTGLTADADGRMLVRPGTVLVPDAAPGEYRVAQSLADITGDEGPPAVAAAAQVLILATIADLSGGKGLVGAYFRGGFLGTRMPSLADNAVGGLEEPVKAELRTRGFVFGEDFGPRGRQ